MKKIPWNIESKMPGRFTIGQWLLISCLFSLSSLALRIIMSGRLSYGFLAWNLFLAFVPYFIANRLNSNPQVLKSRIKSIPMILAWILFMPNSFYILTDLFHLNNIGNDRSWFDLTLILSFAWNGILFGILSIQKMETILKRVKGSFVCSLVICAVIWLNAFGVYIGRFLRFNSWDIFINPFSLFSELGNMILNPYSYKYVWAMNSFFALFIIIIYYTTKRLGEVFKNG